LECCSAPATALLNEFFRYAELQDFPRFEAGEVYGSGGKFDSTSTAAPPVQGLEPGSARHVSRLGITGAVLVDSKGGAAPTSQGLQKTEWLKRPDLKLRNLLLTAS
jgi:hypothetical protein